MGAGGRAGGAHTLGEWYDPAGREIGLQRLFADLARHRRNRKMRILKLGICAVALLGAAILLWAVRSPAAGRYRAARETASDGASQAKEPMDQATGPADLALINGVIYTGDSKQPRVEALAARGETIIATAARPRFENSSALKPR